MGDAFFRAGVGAVVLDPERRILVMRRKGASEGAWQLPQGGVEIGETPVEAFHRELREETGLGRNDIELLGDSGEWWVYELPAEYRNAKVGWGQAQRWYLCHLLVPPTAVRPDLIEFDDAEWVTAARLLARAAAFRRPVYQRLIERFQL